ncbi:hypothetical protein Pla108_37860 [Botrimarina colliarenosi]|uniref:Peptidase MA-like domain-containing protein n=1 Tax=Botrimarina colliarenosi TaxID=2528001 RepID=A0A5C6A2G9_9BACT|nr:hypothetical protein [Botrimarina colliarenosi]TWT94074.1 hypothetical protein Pla108_37860 [Botrimarina colliarenosi]
MEARLTRRVGAAAAVVALVGVAAEVAAQRPAHNVSLRRAAGYRTANFVVQAPTAELAREIGESAEELRESLAIEWVGQPMPQWSEPCPIQAKVSPALGAGGATTFVFDRGTVFGWEMEVQGSRERVLDSVLPHEITHTVFASYFRQPLPRWADEGACTTVEHRSEIAKQERLLIQFLKTGKGIPFSKMFAMKEYPVDILPLYSQGHSLTQFLIEGHGKQEFLEFLADGMQDENWRRVVQKHYGYDSLYELQNEWLGWVRADRPRLDNRSDAPVQLASANEPITPIRDLSQSSLAKQPSVYAQQLEPAPTPPMASVYSGGKVWR